MASEYLDREAAAKKQLGKKGVKKRVKQLPTAARASLREMTGVDISRKGVSVDPIGLAMAVSPFKLLKAAKALRAAGMARPYSVANRVAKEGLADQFFSRAITKLDGRNVSKEIAKRNSAGRSTELPMAAARGLKVSREASESVFPRGPKGKTSPITNRILSLQNMRRGNVSEGSVNIVDTRRMNPAQAKSALEKGVNQTATFKRGVPSKPKNINKVTKRLLGGR